MKEFSFVGCIEVKELLGIRADSELHLLELIGEVPVDSIYFHTHSYFLRHVYLAGQYPNDFANWAALERRDFVLGEKLGYVTPSADKSLEDVRENLLDIIDRHISTSGFEMANVQSRPFYFMKSNIINIPTGISVSSLKDFVDVLKEIHASAIYNHIFEARIRAKRGRSDFAVWFEDALGLKELAARIEKIDCYMYSLEGLRKEIIESCEMEL